MLLFEFDDFFLFEERRGEQISAEVPMFEKLLLFELFLFLELKK
jgi:hypothetical protein